MEKKQTSEAALEASDPAAFRLLLKIGIYKSMHSKGMISQTQLFRLIEKQKQGNIICH